MHAGVRSAGRHGFTLQEMLVVLLVFVVLSLLFFPIATTVRSPCRQGACVSRLHHITQMLKVYHDDWGTYPDGLYGVAYDGGPLQLRLGGPDYINDPSAFTCDRHPRGRRNPKRRVSPIDPMTGRPVTDLAKRRLSFAESDSYSFQFRPAPSGGTTEVHYNRSWTRPPGKASEKRQLMFAQPPDDTLVTWCLYHDALDEAGDAIPGKVATVAFLNGRVQKLPVERLADWWPACTSPRGGRQPSGCPWQVKPKP